MRNHIRGRELDKKSDLVQHLDTGQVRYKKGTDILKPDIVNIML